MKLLQDLWEWMTDYSFIVVVPMILTVLMMIAFPLIITGKWPWECRHEKSTFICLHADGTTTEIPSPTRYNRRLYECVHISREEITGRRR